MKTLAICLSLALLPAGSAMAACDFDIAPAKGLKASMVRVYSACPSTELPFGNTATEGGVEACTPVSPAEFDGQPTLYSYGPNGGCTVQFKSRLVQDCQSLEDSDGNPLNLQPGSCHVTYVKAKCKEILGADGVSGIGPDDAGFSLVVVSRASLADEIGGDMTVVDFPVSFEFDEPKNGSMSLSSHSAEALLPLVGGAAADLPGCTSIELLSVKILDPEHRPFARLGASTAP